MNELINKYEKLQFLVNVEEKDKLRLSQLYEDFIRFLLPLESTLVWGKCDFGILFIPLIRKLYLEYGETDYEKVYNNFKGWYDGEGILWEEANPDLDNFGFMALFLTTYESNKKIN